VYSRSTLRLPESVPTRRSSDLELPLKPWASCRREDLLGLLGMLNQQVGTLDAAVQKAAEENPQARLLMTQPGVGPNTALAFVLTDRKSTRLNSSDQIISYAVFF